MEMNNKLREAVVEIIDYLEPIRKWTMPSKENRTRLTTLFAVVDTVYTKAKNALAEPVKNCEVGTVDDWLARFSVVCERCSGSDCDHRLFKDEEVFDCFARWLQMPYKEGENK